MYMKLYGTITSERATKGQGGKYLFIEVLNEQKKRIAQLSVHPESIKIWTDEKISLIKTRDEDMCDHSAEDVLQKGEKQKGECLNKDANGNACYNCESGQGGECGSAKD